MDTVQKMHAPINTSACLTRATIHASPVQTGNQSPKNNEAMHTQHTLQLQNTSLALKF